MQPGARAGAKFGLQFGEFPMKLFKAAMPYFAWLMVLLLTYASLAYAAPASRPFKATLEMTVTGQGRGPDCPEVAPGLHGGAQTLSGTGHATHLGAVNATSSHCVDLVQQVNFYFFNGHMTLTSPNSDVVHVDYSGFLTLVSPGVYSFEGNYFIKNGTGRFQDASGTGALFGTGDFSNVLTLTAEGRISY
jgi:hypothetical protein